MPKKRVVQAGGKKEAPLAVVGSSGLGSNQQREQTFTPEDAEFQYYKELLSGFFDTLTKWQNIFGQYAQPIENWHTIIPSYYPSPYKFERALDYKGDVDCAFEVLKTPKGLKRIPLLPFGAEHP